MRSILRFALKVVISGLCLWVAFHAVPLSDVLTLVASMDAAWLLLALFFMHLSHVISALRTRYYLSVAGHPVSVKAALKLHYIGGMFNMMLPSAVGGDAYKIWFLRKETNGSLSSMVKLMLANRANGLWLLLLLLAALLMVHPSLPNRLYAYYAWILASALTLSACYHLIANRLLKEPVKVQYWAGLYSLGLQVSGLLCAYMLLRGMGADAVLDYLITLLISIVATLMPVSIGGIGVREWVMLQLSGVGSLNETHAVTLAFAFTLCYLSVSLMGALIYFASAAQKKDQS